MTNQTLLGQFRYDLERGEILDHQAPAIFVNENVSAGTPDIIFGYRTDYVPARLAMIVQVEILGNLVGIIVRTTERSECIRVHLSTHNAAAPQPRNAPLILVLDVVAFEEEGEDD